MKIYEPQITFIFSQGRACPVLICGVCSKPLEAPGRQMVAWDMSKEGANLHLYPVHKALDGRTCLTRLEHHIEANGGYMGTIELSDFLGQLMHNSGYEVPVKVERWVGDFYRLKPRNGALKTIR